MTDWTCPVCGFDAANEEQKKEHRDRMTDTAHQELFKMKAQEKARDVKENVEDKLEDMRDKVSGAVSDIGK